MNGDFGILWYGVWRLAEVFLDGETGGDHVDEPAKDDGGGKDGDEPLGVHDALDVVYADAVAGQARCEDIEGDEADDSGEDAGEDAADFGFYEEGAADEAVAGAD